LDPYLSDASPSLDTDTHTYSHKEGQEEIDISAIRTYFFTNSPSFQSNGTIASLHLPGPNINNPNRPLSVIRYQPPSQHLASLWNASQIRSEVPILNLYKGEDSISTASFDGVALAYGYPSVDSGRALVTSRAPTTRTGFGEPSNRLPSSLMTRVDSSKGDLAGRWGTRRL